MGKQELQKVGKAFILNSRENFRVDVGTSGAPEM